LRPEHTDFGIEKIRQSTCAERCAGLMSATVIRDKALPWTAQHLVSGPYKISGSNPTQYSTSAVSKPGVTVSKLAAAMNVAKDTTTDSIGCLFADCVFAA